MARLFLAGLFLVGTLVPLTALAQDDYYDADFAAQDDSANSDDDDVAPAGQAGEGQWAAQPPPALPTAQPTQIYDSSAGNVASVEAPPSRQPTQQDFDAALSAHGTWVDVPGLGRVWKPSEQEVGDDFVPYVSGGAWANVSSGWVFRTQWNWGWAPFHYGRWYLEPTYGWVWWPNSTWAPAWVDWRWNNGYVGWAPLPPPRFRLSFGFGAPGWSFASYNHFCGPQLYSHLWFPARGHAGWGWSRSPTWAPSWHHASAVNRSWGSGVGSGAWQGHSGSSWNGNRSSSAGWNSNRSSWNNNRSGWSGSSGNHFGSGSHGSSSGSGWHSASPAAPSAPQHSGGWHNGGSNQPNPTPPSGGWHGGSAHSGGGSNFSRPSNNWHSSSSVPSGGWHGNSTPTPPSGGWKVHNSGGGSSNGGGNHFGHSGGSRGRH